MSTQTTKDLSDAQTEPSNTGPPSFDANNAVEASEEEEEEEEEPDNGTSTQPDSQITPTKKPNAFEKLMSSTQDRMFKRVKLTPSLEKVSQHLTKPGRNGLGLYQVNPASFPPDVVVYHNPSFVVVTDMYPKASVHLLLLPRTEEKNTLHPFFAFQDEALLAATKAEAEKVKVLVGEELRRLFGKVSVAERERREAIASGVEGEIPAGRDWAGEVMVGIHAGPSMNHLHVHVLSRDMASPCLRHRKHYNSFNSSFFVRLEELPLDESDPRWRASRGGGLKEELRCWRCGKGFENKFGRLKEHLAEEFEEWKTQ